MFYDCGDNRNEWVPGAYEDVTMSTDKNVIEVRKKLEHILKNLPAPDYDDPELAGQWVKNWINTTRYLEPYVPPYLLPVNNTVPLQNAIDSTRALLESAIVGSEGGEYSQEVIDMALSAINEAQSVLDSTIFQSDVNSAMEALVEALTGFVPNPVGINPGRRHPLCIYPNPVSNTLHICAENAVSYKICNLNGGIIINKNIEGNRIDVASLTAGFYFIEVKMKDDTVGKSRFVKQIES